MSREPAVGVQAERAERRAPDHLAAPAPV